MRGTQGREGEGHRKKEGELREGEGGKEREREREEGNNEGRQGEKVCVDGRYRDHDSIFAGAQLEAKASSEHSAETTPGPSPSS